MAILDQASSCRRGVDWWSGLYVHAMQGNFVELNLIAGNGSVSRALGWRSKGCRLLVRFPNVFPRIEA